MSSDSSDTPIPAEVYCVGLPLAPENHGRCFSCGFLRRSLPGMGYQEINWLSRWSILPSLSRAENSEGLSVQPTAECMLGIRDLPNEIGLELGPVQSDLERAAHVVFWKDRKCPKWQPYQPVKSLEQYYAEVFMHRLEELREQQATALALEQRKLDERLSIRDEQLQLTLSGRNEQLQLERGRTQEREAELARRITRAGLVIALILGSAQILTLTKESLLWKIVAALYHWFVH